LFCFFCLSVLPQKSYFFAHFSHFLFHFINFFFLWLDFHLVLELFIDDLKIIFMFYSIL
jgi:hypothetical protein